MDSTIAPRVEAKYDLDPLAAARRRGWDARFRLLAEIGSLLTAELAALRMGISSLELEDRRRNHELIGIDITDGINPVYVYPEIQFGVAHLDVVMQSGKFNDFTCLTFLLNPNAWLEGHRPIDVLRQGDYGAVTLAIEMYGEQCAI